MKDLIRDIVVAQQALNDFYRIKSRPAARPPCSADDMAALERHMAAHSLPLPPSYRDFLAVADGIENWDVRLDLRRARDVMQPADPSLVSDFPALAPFIIGAGNRAAFIAFDTGTADAAGEMEVVWISDEGDEDRYPTFGAFLTTYRDILRKNVERETADRNNLRR